jgi:hypothetical protein
MHEITPAESALQIAVDVRRGARHRSSLVQMQTAFSRTRSLDWFAGEHLAGTGQRRHEPRQ